MIVVGNPRYKREIDQDHEIRNLKLPFLGMLGVGRLPGAVNLARPQETVRLVMPFHIRLSSRSFITSSGAIRGALPVAPWLAGPAQRGGPLRSAPPG